MKNVMSMGELGNQFTEAMAVQTYEYLKGQSIEDIKDSIYDRGEFMSGIMDLVLVTPQANGLRKKFNLMKEFLLDVGEEEVLHEMMFDALESGLNKLSRDFSNL